MKLTTDNQKRDLLLLKGELNYKGGFTHSLLATVLNLICFLGFTPFRVSLNSETDHYEIVQLHPVCKFICALHHFGYEFNFIYYYFIGAATYVDLQNTSGVIEMIASLGAMVLCLSLIFTLWRKQEQLLRIVEMTKIRCSQRTVLWRQLLVTILFAATYLVNYYIMIWYNSVQLFEAIRNWKWEEFSVYRVYRIYIYHISCFSNIAYFFVGMIGPIMWDVKQKYCVYFTQAQDINSGLTKSSELTCVASEISRCFGNFIAAFYVVTVPFYSQFPLLSWTNMNGQLMSMILLSIFGFMLWFPLAEYEMAVSDAFKQFLDRMEKQINLDNLNIKIHLMWRLMKDGQLNSVGISCRFFTINYSFIGSMMGLIVTYVVIIVQMKSSAAGPSTVN